MNKLSVDTISTSSIGLSITISPGVWCCSYVVRLWSPNSSTVSSINAYITGTPLIANVSPDVVSYNTQYFSPAIIVSSQGTNNLSMSGSGVITSVSTATIILNSAVVTGTGVTNYYLDQTYLLATRIALTFRCRSYHFRTTWTFYNVYRYNYISPRR